MNVTNINSPVAENVKKIIDSKGLKQIAVAKKSGYSLQMFNSMLHGRKVIKVSDVTRIKKALDVTYEELYQEGESD